MLMKAKGLGIFSAAVSTVCCGGPIVFAALGLGGLGFGAFFAAYAGYFILAAAFLLLWAWRSYFKEKSCCAIRPGIAANRKGTRRILVLMTLVVFIFSGIHLFSFFKARVAGSPLIGKACFSCFQGENK